jgi:hypothetical protein
MSHLLELAEHYYAVARDLEAHAYDLNKMGQNLFEIADHLCEQNMKETAKEPATEPAKTTVQPSPVQVCNWRCDDDGLWTGDCGIEWCIEYEPLLPSAHGMLYCPKCGKTLAEHPYVEPPVCGECVEELEDGKCPAGCATDNQATQPTAAHDECLGCSSPTHCEQNGCAIKRQRPADNQPTAAPYKNPHCLNDGTPCNPDGAGGCTSCDYTADSAPAVIPAPLNVDGIILSDGRAMLIGTATWDNDTGKYRCGANVEGALCVVEIKVTPHADSASVDDYAPVTALTDYPRNEREQP